MTRVGVDFRFGADGCSLRAVIGFLRIKLLPPKPPKKKKQDIPEPEQPQEPQPEQPAEQEPSGTEQKSAVTETGKKPGFLQSLDVKKLIPIAFEALARFSKKLRFDVLELRVLAAADSPDKAAVLYGRVCAALGVGLPFLVRVFNVRRQRVSADLSFSRTKLSAEGRVKVTIRIGSVVWIALWALVKVLGSRKV